MTVQAPASSARADLYGLLAELLSFPTESLERAVANGDVDAALGHLVGHLPFEMPEVPDSERTEAAVGLESEYIRLFDAPIGGGTPLYTGVYARRRRDAMEEILRFYRHFGLTLASDSHDLPDFVPTVLEFLRFLALRAEAEEAAGHRVDAARAHADIIERHLLPWAKQTVARLRDRDPHPYYFRVISLLAIFAAAELDWLRARTAAAS